MKNTILISNLLFIFSVSLFILGCEVREEAKQPTACFNFSPSSDITPGDEVTFTNCSTEAETYEWDFGDGKNSVAKEPKHKYDEPGEYTVTLIVDNKGLKDEMSDEVVVNSNIVACFSLSPNPAEIGQNITFTNCSENADTYDWDIDGDGTIDSHDTNPVFYFNVAGTFTTKLIAKKGDYSDEVTHQVTINASSVTACFSMSPNPANLNQSVTFTNCSTGATSYEWDFNNDGTTDSNYENPLVTFSQAGTYNVKLTAHSSTSSNSVTHQLVVKSGEIIPTDYNIPVGWVEHYTNEFITTGDWTEETTSDYSAVISDGIYSITNFSTENSWFFWTNTSTIPATTEDYDLEMYYKVNYDNVTQGSGLIWALNSTSFDYYFFKFTPYEGKGYFSIGDKDISPWSDGNYWEGGSISAYNKITARKYGNNMYFFMNEVYYTTIPFEGNYGDFFGFIVGADAKISIEWVGLWIMDLGTKSGQATKTFTPVIYQGTPGKGAKKLNSSLK